jgi:hypothetical protein
MCKVLLLHFSKAFYDGRMLFMVLIVQPTYVLVEI